MSQYLYTPAGAPGSAPAGLTPFGASRPGDWTIQSADSVPVLQAFRNAAPAGDYGLSLDAAAADPHSDAIEILGKFSGGTDAAGGLCFARASGVAGHESFLYARLGQVLSRRGLLPGVIVGQYQDGIASINVAASFAHVPGGAYQYRFKVANAQVSLRVWADGSPEPATWLIDSVNFGVPGVGLAGVFAPAIAAPNIWYAFGVGTGGDPAPAI